MNRELPRGCHTVMGVWEDTQERLGEADETSQWLGIGQPEGMEQAAVILEAGSWLRGSWNYLVSVSVGCSHMPFGHAETPTASRKTAALRDNDSVIKPLSTWGTSGSCGIGLMFFQFTVYCFLWKRPSGKQGGRLLISRWCCLTHAALSGVFIPWKKQGREETCRLCTHHLIP